MEQQRIQYDLKIKSLSTIIMENKTTILSLESHNLSLSEQLAKKADVESQLSIARDHVNQMIGQKEKIQQELENSTDYILELEEKVYKANKTSLELLK